MSFITSKICIFVLNLERPATFAKVKSYPEEFLVSINVLPREKEDGDLDMPV